jgi:hypothetical protein
MSVSSLKPVQSAPLLQHHRQWQPGQALIAAEGGADRRSAKNADAPHGSIARSAPCGAAAPLPRGGPVGRGLCGRLAPRGATPAGTRRQPARGYASGARRDHRRVLPSTADPSRDRQGCEACLAKQHAPKAPPPTGHGQWPTASRGHGAPHLYHESWGEQGGSHAGGGVLARHPFSRSPRTRSKQGPRGVPGLGGCAEDATGCRPCSHSVCACRVGWWPLLAARRARSSRSNV